jgi:hypothetical protein
VPCSSYPRHQPRLAGFGAARDGEDGLAALGQRGTAQEVHLPADARDHARPDGVGAHLTGQVDLDGGVDGAHLRVARDHGGVVHVGDVELQHVGVVVDEVEQPARAGDEAADDATAVDLLLRVVDGARQDQVERAVGPHLGVDAQVTVAMQRAAHRVGDRADAHLQGGAVVDEAGDVASDGVLLGRRGLRSDAACDVEGCAIRPPAPSPSCSASAPLCS